MIKVNYTYSDEINTIKSTLEYLPNIIACDFEVANKYYKNEIEELKLLNYNILTDNINQQINANGLSHPSLTTITHFNIAWSDKDAFVCICKDLDIKNYIYEFLTTTKILQLWHNTCFDFKHIYYHTKKFPINFEDTMLLAKCLKNDANGMKGKVGLKELMGNYYGAWGQAREADFILENMYNETMLLYSATDACATYKLYEMEVEYLGLEKGVV